MTTESRISNQQVHDLHEMLSRRVRAGETLAMTTMTVNGKTFEVDDEIASIVHALNAAGISTVASCSGHGMRPGRISLADGRELFVLPSYEIGQWFDTQFPRDINGQTKEERADTIRALLAERDALRAERDELAEQLRLATIAEALAEAEANDAVIAAAPDLLALAKAYASECEICGGSGRLRGDGWQKPCDACADIRAVISRAEGRSDE